MWRIITTILVMTAAIARADDWRMWGGTPARNMVSSEKRLPEKIAEDGAKWIAPVGSQSYGNPTVANGRVFVGTNNDPGRVAERQGDFGVVLCLDEQTGKLLWQLTAPKLKAGGNLDFEQVGICSSPTVDNDHVYIVTNRCEVMCLDAKGLSDGNDGAFKNEAKYLADSEAPAELLPTDADILWIFDMRDELGVFPHQMTSSSVLAVDDRLYVTTSNGADWTDEHIPSPNAPALICLDKNSGQLLGAENSGISARTFKCNWSSPAYGVVDGRAMVIFGGDDGFCYAFDPVPSDGVLKELWRIDCNPAEYRSESHKGPRGASGILATPVLSDGKVYVSLGRDPDEGDGPGAISSINAKTGAIVWMNKTIGRSLSTVAVADGLLYTTDFGGKVYCLDATTGEQVWKHDAEGTIWASPLLADGKIYIGTENATMWVLAAGREKKVLSDATLGGNILATTVAANGVLYVLTGHSLIATEQK